MEPHDKTQILTLKTNEGKKDPDLRLAEWMKKVKYKLEVCGGYQHANLAFLWIDQ